MRLGLFGGSFDPVHVGHLLLAECCREQCRLDRVDFLPASVPPHKRGRTLSSAEHRIEMLELAIGGNESFAVSRYEIDQGGVSFTIQTLRHYRVEDPDADLFFLLGADMLADLPHWRDASEVCRLATPVAVCRPGVGEPDFDCLSSIAPDRVESIRASAVKMPQIEFSSSEIRRRVAEQRSIRYQTPRAVEKYIETHRLFTMAADSA